MSIDLIKHKKGYGKLQNRVKIRKKQRICDGISSVKLLYLLVSIFN